VVLDQELDLAKLCATGDKARPGVARLYTAFDKAYDEVVARIDLCYPEEDNKELNRLVTLWVDCMCIILRRGIPTLGRVTYNQAKKFFDDCFETECEYPMVKLEAQKGRN
jgi:hypothetical protein